MKNILVWDLPVRLFHWILAASFFGAFLIANLVGDDSQLFPLHMLLGATMGFMVVLRAVWGFVGPRWSRFKSFVFGPGDIWTYFRKVLSGEGDRHTGHNPGSSLAIFAILALVVAQVTTGLMMSTGSEAAEELHEIFAWAFLATVVVHITGVVVHSIQHRELLVMSMISGRKEGEEAEEIPSTHPVVALVFLGLTAGWAGGLYANYDAATGEVRLPVVNTTLQVGEGEEHEHEHEEH